MSDVPPGPRRRPLFRVEALDYFERMDSFAIPFAVRRPRRIWLVVALACLAGALLLSVGRPAWDGEAEPAGETPPAAAALRPPSP